MILYKCVCGWSYVLGKRDFYGPIFEDGTTSAARMQPIKDFRDAYDDCWWRYKLIKKGAANAGKV